ncbi:hypothetical protein GNI_169930 [Gregarina niphandrodes]|uniref:Uncharacterized protein n=1 Tax=Gregarina niphandrodes TaxID=110365 RepID=A0A023AXW2_GRENI|nr:hypothetical protein GNI_169930 [Gregarina niphandrodes]EZG43492.1 hypothetical protein GNI_169930 [Gregarina niphandrodes]|eukprot:XP_011133274.1 hypothetical protein GNI_169930 [Gregarina niphandrodes]
MRGFTASDAQEVSPLLSVLTGVTFDVGSPGEEICASLVEVRPVLDRRLTAPCGVPPAMPNCVRLGLDGHDKISPKFLLTIALQTVDQMLKNEGTLFSPEQIQLLSKEEGPTVCLDLEGADKYDDAKTAADEPERAKMAQDIFLRWFKDGRVGGKYKSSREENGDVLAVLEKPWATVSEFREALVKVYSTYEPSGDYVSGVWKGICRPVLVQGWKVPKVAVGPAFEGKVCPRCEPGPLVSLPTPPSRLFESVARRERTGSYGLESFVPDNHHVPLNEWVVEGFNEVFTMDEEWPVSEVLTGAWGYNVDRMSRTVQDEADKQGVICTPFPWQCTWKPSTPSGRRPDGFLELSQKDAAAIVQAEMDEHIKYWRVLNLGDMVKSYRLTPHLVYELETQADKLVKEARLVEEITDKDGHAERLAPNEPRDLNKFNKPSNDGWYIGSYAQVYVVLEFKEDGTASGLRVATVPMCLNAKSANEAKRKQELFWNQVRRDAGSEGAFKYSLEKR